MKTRCAILLSILPILLLISACSDGGGSSKGATVVIETPLVVNTVSDTLTPLVGENTLRKAIDLAESGEVITFDPKLNGLTIQLDIVGEEHSILKGEVFTFTGRGFSFDGFQDRDYGKSALYARKNLIIDASALPDGITINWNGGANRARVLAVYGNLTMNNVAITSGYAEFEALADVSQPFTLGRGGGLAVWGIASLSGCTLSGNVASGDIDTSAPSRDRGAFGGALYANSVNLNDCIISGNRVTGFGAAGGGIYSVGGADRLRRDSTLRNSTISGNSVTGQHAYGGGIYSDGGGPGNLFGLDITNCTIARNLVEDHPDLDESTMFQFYYRGGGVYMSNGHLSISSSTIVENQVIGNPHVFLDKLGLDRPNMGGGGVAATIGDAHVVEDITINHSIIAGNSINTMDEFRAINDTTADDLFSGSLLHFYSGGYNLIGSINFDFMLAPIPLWQSLSRKHWPKVGDQHDVIIDDVLSIGDAAYHDTITSMGTDRIDPTPKAVLWYPPVSGGPADDVVPFGGYGIDYTNVEFSQFTYGESTLFLTEILARLSDDFWADNIVADMGDRADITFFGPIASWPSDDRNTDWVAFWRELDAYIASQGEPLGPQRLGDEFWGSFAAAPLPSVSLNILTHTLGPVRLADVDQRNTPRAVIGHGDIGAIEID